MPSIRDQCIECLEEPAPHLQVGLGGQGLNQAWGPASLPVPRPVMGGWAIEGFHSCEQPLAGWHRGWQADVFGVQRLVLVVLQL